jgi:hypothetical protein
MDSILVYFVTNILVNYLVSYVIFNLFMPTFGLIVRLPFAF